MSRMPYSVNICTTVHNTPHVECALQSIGGLRRSKGVEYLDKQYRYSTRETKMFFLHRNQQSVF